MYDVNWPQTNEPLKVVQFNIGGILTMRFGALYDLHRNILAKYLDSCGIQYETIEDPITHAIRAVSKGERYEAVGMGRARVDIDQKKIDFHDMSGDYMMGINVDHLRQMKESAGGREFFTWTGRDGDKPLPV